MNVSKSNLAWMAYVKTPSDPLFVPVHQDTIWRTALVTVI